MRSVPFAERVAYQLARLGATHQEAEQIIAARDWLQTEIDADRVPGFRVPLFLGRVFYRYDVLRFHLDYVIDDGQVVVVHVSGK